jgi:hypothetical protein
MVTSSGRASLRGRLIERPDQVEHHRWFPPPPGHDRGLHPFDGPTRAMLHQMRWRKSPPDHRRLWAALTIALFLHVLFVVVVWYEMKPGGHLYQAQVVQAPADNSIQVRFITHSAKAAPAAPPVPVPPPLPVTRPVREPVSKNAMTLHMPGPAPAPAANPQPQPAPATSAPPVPQLFDRTGRIILPASTSSAPAADYVQRGPEGDTQVMQHNAGNQYKSAPNQFQKYFPPPKESFVGGLMRKLNGSESNTKSVDLPHGIHLKCQKVLGIPIPNCGIPPDPPPPTDGDERLNMAPASLTKGGNAPAKPDVATCIAIYKAGKPLPYGCPVDTPARAASVQKPASSQSP